MSPWDKKSCNCLLYSTWLFTRQFLSAYFSMFCCQCLSPWTSTDISALYLSHQHNPECAELKACQQPWTQPSDFTWRSNLVNDLRFLERIYWDVLVYRDVRTRRKRVGFEWYGVDFARRSFWDLVVSAEIETEVTPVSSNHTPRSHVTCPLELRR